MYSNLDFFFEELNPLTFRFPSLSYLLSSKAIPPADNLFKAQHLTGLILSADAFRCTFCTVIV